jgi:hypothetical protein
MEVIRQFQSSTTYTARIEAGRIPDLVWTKWTGDKLFALSEIESWSSSPWSVALRIEVPRLTKSLYKERIMVKKKYKSMESGYRRNNEV